MKYYYIGIILALPSILLTTVECSEVCENKLHNCTGMMQPVLNEVRYMFPVTQLEIEGMCNQTANHYVFKQQINRHYERKIPPKQKPCLIASFFSLSSSNSSTKLRVMSPRPPTAKTNEEWIHFKGRERMLTQQHHFRFPNHCSAFSALDADTLIEPLPSVPRIKKERLLFYFSIVFC
ncbi:hypothetical protein CDAR_14511 [Caerostris darwini]|uniref:Uncharacterized protein n=1 Tax=Caerostris darwini TaxID=1538125 RepID=A0AAV4R6A0_9ARAC|nr:hypothetical protein CDAR_14511 [Caerostris darwini]